MAEGRVRPAQKSLLEGWKIVFMPGIDGTGISFGPLQRVFPNGTEVQVVRYPADELLDFRETVENARSQVTINERTIVIAESFSGPVAVALIGSGQIRPGGLVLCATFARSPRPLLIKTLLHLPLALLIRLPFPGSLFSLVVEGGRESTRVFVDLWDEIKKEVPAKTLVNRLRLIDRLDVRPLLSQLKVPCCYIQASGDRTVPPSMLRDFTEAIPGLIVKRINGPHFILQANPHGCLTAITEFLESTLQPLV